MRKLRLLMFKDCQRACYGCCLKDWNLDALEETDDFAPYDMVLLTGGEPMLRPHLIDMTVSKIRKQSSAKIVLYTAKTNEPIMLLRILLLVDGLTITLHDADDVEPFYIFDKLIQRYPVVGKSLRLNIFNEVGNYQPVSNLWEIKDNMEWITNCPLPAGEEFKRLKI